MTTCGLMVELSGWNCFSSIWCLKITTKIIPTGQRNSRAPSDIHKAIFVFSHASFITFFFAHGWLKISANWNNILKIFHWNFPTIFFLLKNFVRQVGKDSPHVERGGMFEPRHIGRWIIGAKHGKGFARPRQTIRKHDHSVAIQQIFFDLLTTWFVNGFLSHKFHRR